MREIDNKGETDVKKNNKKRVNPRRQIATMADVRKASKTSADEAVAATRTIFLTVLRDKMNFGEEQLVEFWKHVEKLADEILEGRVSIADLKRVLADEAGIIL